MCRLDPPEAVRRWSRLVAGSAWLRVNLVEGSRETFGLVSSRSRVSDGSAVVSVYDDELDDESPTISGTRFRPWLISPARLVAETEGIKSDGRCLPREAVDSSQSAHHRLVDLISSAPIRNRLAVKPQAIQDLVYVTTVNHVPGQRAIPPILRTPLQEPGSPKQ